MIAFIFELILQLFGELLLDGAAHAVGESERAQRTLLQVVLFAILGGVMGGLSLLVFPEHFIRDGDLRLASLIVTPIVAGALFATIGRRRVRKAKYATALEAFWPAWAFALAMAVARYFGAA